MDKNLNYPKSARRNKKSESELPAFTPRNDVDEL